MRSEDLPRHRAAKRRANRKACPSPLSLQDFHVSVRNSRREFAAEYASTSFTAALRMLIQWGKKMTGRLRDEKFALCGIFYCADVTSHEACSSLRRLRTVFSASL